MPKIDASSITTKGAFHANYGAQLFLRSGRLFLAAVYSDGSTYANVIVWYWAAGVWLGLIGPSVLKPTAMSLFDVSTIAADATGGSLWIAYNGTKDFGGIGVYLNIPHVVRFDMDTLAYDTPITTWPHDSDGGTHTNAAGLILSDVALRRHIWATSSGAFTLATQGTLGGDLHTNIYTTSYSGGSWGTPAVRGRALATQAGSDLIAGGGTWGGAQHLIFATGDGALYHQQIGSSASLIASDLKMPTSTVGPDTLTLSASSIGKGFYESGDIVVPYKNSAGYIAVAKRISGVWSTETVNTTKTVYSPEIQAPARVESNHGSPAGAWYINGAWNVAWWDDANNNAVLRGAAAAAQQTLWRSTYSSGAWSAPSALIQDTYLMHDVDAMVDGTTLRLIYQVYDTYYLNPWVLFSSEGAAGTIQMPGIESTSSFGAFSGITGGKPGTGLGCGSGGALPRLGPGIRSGCKTYTAV